MIKKYQLIMLLFIVTSLLDLWSKSTTPIIHHFIAKYSGSTDIILDLNQCVSLKAASKVTGVIHILHIEDDVYYADLKFQMKLNKAVVADWNGSMMYSCPIGNDTGVFDIKEVERVEITGNGIMLSLSGIDEPEVITLYQPKFPADKVVTLNTEGCEEFIVKFFVDGTKKNSN